MPPEGDVITETTTTEVKPAPPAGPSTTNGENGFPVNTPLEVMSVDQREAYWKHQSQRWEGRAKKFDGMTDDDFAALKDKAGRHDALEHELMSDKDKAVADAKREAQGEVTSKYLPRLVRAEFKAAAAGRPGVANLTALLDPLDLSKFVTESGEVDEAKVAAWVDTALPVTTTATPRGSSTTGAGGRSSTVGPSLASGQDAYRRRHPSKS